MIVSCQQLTKYHGAQLVLDQISLEIRAGERVGLIGRNGSGKSTLLQLLSGTLLPDEGQLAVRKGTKIGYLTQIPEDTEHQTVYDVLAKGYRPVLALRSQMAELEEQMSQASHTTAPALLENLLKSYADMQERFEREGGYEMDTRIEQVAQGLRISAEEWARSYGTLSGGEKTKVALAALLIERPTLLLLDEPTNHLDLQGVEWLESYIGSYEGACLIVSHDRYFLDRVVTRIIELEDGEASVYDTDYTGYVREKEERLLRQFAEYQEQQKKIKQMRETIKQLENWGRIGGNEKFFRRAASMQKALDRMEKLKRPILERRSAEFDAVPSDRSGQDVLFFEGLCKGYGDRILLDHADGLLRYGEKVVMIGDNGSGKSTLFKLLLSETEPDEGTVSLGARVEWGYLAQEESPGGSKKTVLQFFREEAGVEDGEARSLLARYLFYGPDVFKSVHLLSGGEWSRLRLALIMRKKPNLLLLDEPTNHLDIASREALEEALDDFPGTILAISHDRYFINRVAGKVWELQKGNVTGYAGNFDDYKEARAKKDGKDEGNWEKTKAVGKIAANGLAAGSGHSRPDSKAAEKTATASSGRGRTGNRKSTPDVGRVEVRLEEEIADKEKALAALDAILEAFGSGHNADADAALETWKEREALQAELDRLYGQWMESETGGVPGSTDAVNDLKP